MKFVSLVRGNGIPKFTIRDREGFTIVCGDAVKLFDFNGISIPRHDGDEVDIYLTIDEPENKAGWAKLKFCLYDAAYMAMELYLWMEQKDPTGKTFPDVKNMTYVQTTGEQLLARNLFPDTMNPWSALLAYATTAGDRHIVPADETTDEYAWVCFTVWIKEV